MTRSPSKEPAPAPSNYTVEAMPRFLGSRGRAMSSVQSGRRWRGRALAAGVAVACLASLVGAATAGTRTPSAAAAGKLDAAGSLDYSPDGAGRLRRLDPSFV